MGYKRNKIYKLVFADPEFEGLEVRARSVSTGKFLEIVELAKLRDRESTELSAEDMAKVTGMLEVFAGALISWNLEDDDDQPVPATHEGLLSQDLDFVLDLVKAWMDAVVSVPDDVGKGSASGVTFPEASLPMDPLSDARLSLSGRN
ncbi:MAG: hypothetical protein ACRDP6_42215 [Actinoallomurus sp.]